MIEGGNLRELTQQERRKMKRIYEITVERRRLMDRVEEEMNKEFKQVIKEMQYDCRVCNKSFKGPAFAQHYKTKQKCKYMKDRPFLKELPDNWKEDLEVFRNDEESKEKK